jgi:hypothetical protein
MLDFATTRNPAPQPSQTTKESVPSASQPPSEPQVSTGNAAAPAAPQAPPPRRRRKRPKLRHFSATSAMRRYAEVLCAPDCPVTEEERCQRADIGVRRLHVWRRQYEYNDFENWLQNEIRLILSRRMVEVWNELHRLVKKGNFQAAKFLVQHCPTSSPTPWKR